MANERMYVLHVPSGGYCYLAKRMGWGWYGLRDAEARLTALFSAQEHCELEGDQDAFVIAFEGDPRLKTLIKARE
jgi:hypothetical protein